MLYRVLGKRPKFSLSTVSKFYFVNLCRNDNR